MSKKKEKKIKRLRKYSLWPQIIETYIVEIAFVVVILFVIILDIFSSSHSLITQNNEVSEGIINVVNQTWDKNTKQLPVQSQEYFNNILKYNYENFDSICIVDDNKNILATYGKNVPSDDFFEDFSKDEFYKNGVYFREDYFDTVTVFNGEDEYGERSDQKTEEFQEFFDPEAEDYDSDNLSVAYAYTFNAATNFHSLRMFRRLFLGSKENKLSNKEFYNWAITSKLKETMWLMYKTDIEGVNVAINKVHFQKTIDEARHAFLLLILMIVFAFIVIYENYRLIVTILSRRKIQRILNTDPVTGGNNKDFFIQKAKKLIRKRRRRNVIVYMRMEKYRNYITAYGIKEGENLMEDFYKLLSTMVKKRKELVAHLEKSDFVLLLHFDNEELLNIRMQSIAKALNDCRPNQHLYFSVGASRIVTKVDDIEEKISNAAAAISKQTNPIDTVLWFDESMREEQVWERRVEDDMDKALENHEFQVYLQPKYSTKKEQLSAAEALVRWIHPENGFISPGRFIPIFEKNGFIIKLDDFMLTEVSKLQAKWLEQGKQLVPISVNVSRAHFSRQDLAEHICGIVDKYKVPHEYIELELTESAFFDDKQTLLGTVKKLKDYGFKVSMDDFGAGYSSLNSLKELPLDIIKLDAQFFRDIEDKKRADLIVCDTIKLAKKLGMQIVAEGIETREQVDFLAEQHCDLIQGFYFAKPLPISEFEERAFG